MVIKQSFNWAMAGANTAMSCDKDCFCSNKCEKCNNVSNH